MLALGGCVTEPTEVLVRVDTDVPADLPLVILATARRGAVTIHDGSFDHAWTRGPGDGGVTLPATFAITPQGQPRDEVVTVLVEGTGPGFAIRRTARFALTPGRVTSLTVFLSGRCLLGATGCTSVDPSQCTVELRCEEQGRTCGDQGTCVDVTSPTMPGAPDGGIDASPFQFRDTAVCGPGHSCCESTGPCPSGQVCTDMDACATCGAGLECCSSGTTCGMGQVCSAADDGCVACGGAGEPCCTGDACAMGAECSAGTCRACGGDGQLCCSGTTCNGGTVCSGGMCAACGGNGQPCCGGGCNGGNVCQGGSCHACGGNGQPCCGGGGCDAGQMCSGGSCTCLATFARCSPGQACCGPDVCATLVSDGLDHCCRQAGVRCSVSDDCCGTLVCCNLGGATGKVCHSLPCP